MFRTVVTEIWTDQKFRKLSSDEKLFFLYLITNTHTHVSGIYYLPSVIIPHETGLSARGIDTLWDTLSGAGLAERDSETEVVWVKNMLFHQGKGEKVYRGVVNHLGTLHKCRLIKGFAERYPELKAYGIDTLLIGYPAQDRVAPVLGTGTGTGTEVVSPPSADTGGAVEDDATKSKRTAFDPCSLAMPPELDSGAFRETWRRWCSYRRELKKKLTETGAEAALKDLASIGQQAATRAIEEAITKGWVGYVKPSEKNHAGNGHGPGMGRNSRVESPPGKYDEWERRASEAGRPATTPPDAEAGKGPAVP